eukprot:757819-Amphidinium_carterae.1
MASSDAAAPAAIRGGLNVRAITARPRMGAGSGVDGGLDAAVYPLVAEDVHGELRVTVSDPVAD